MKKNARYKKPFYILIPVALLFLVSAIVMLLWNEILPDVVGVTTINYWQAMGILVLSKILFGGFHGCKKSGPGFRKRRAFFEKMKHMSPEEKARFKEMWKQRYNKDNFCSR